MAIALLSDFGTRDHFVAAMKGTILTINPSATIIDITHDIEPFNVSAAGFILRACHKDFPEKTIFVTVVDPGVGSNRRPILAVFGNQYFIAPNNGLVCWVAENDACVFELSNEQYFRHPVSGTFHGRDIFAPVAAHLSAGVKPKEFGTIVDDFKQFEIAKPIEYSDREIRGEIIYIDHFGNLITNFSNNYIARGKAVELGETRIGDMRRFYAESTAENLFFIAGSAGFIEISVNRESAREILSAQIGQRLKLLLD